MHIKQRVAWEKLNLELELLNTEEPGSLLPILVNFNRLIQPDENFESFQRQLNFMIYDLQSKTEGLCEEDRFHILNDYFFDLKGYQTTSLGTTPCSIIDEHTWLLLSVCHNRKGADLPVTLLYIHLATQLDLPAYLIHGPSHCILKWVRSGGQSQFIDVSRRAKLLTELEVLELVNRSQHLRDSVACMDILPARHILALYLKNLYQNSIDTLARERRHLILNILLKVDPANLCYLEERSLLRKELGLHKEALSDLKRYFSFTDRQEASPHIKLAAVELERLQQLSQPPTSVEFLH